MRPLRFACLFVIFISTMSLAQSNNVPPINQSAKVVSPGAASGLIRKLKPRPKLEPSNSNRGFHSLHNVHVVGDVRYFRSHFRSLRYGYRRCRDQHPAPLLVHPGINKAPAL
jgi:hypothetical protein